MRCLNTLIVLAMPMFLWSSAAAVAQETNPPGSYQQTCTDISVKKGNLYAKCQDKKGQARSAKLSNYEKCSTEIINANGSLKCARANAPAQPPGPYQQTCKNIQMKGSTLHALCQSTDGREISTSLKDANHCPQGITNNNGVLNCVINSVLPPGSYLATCRDIWWQGTTLEANCNNGKDQWLPAILRNAHKCRGDIANHEGKLRCIEFKCMERR